MAPKFDEREIIQSFSLDPVYERLALLALEFAVLGHLDEARSLITLLNGQTSHHGQESLLRPLNFAWVCTGNWPSGISAEEKTHEALEQLKARYGENMWTSKIDEESRTVDEKGLETAMRVLVDGGNEKVADKTNTFVAELRSYGLVKALEIALALDGEMKEEQGERRHVADDKQHIGDDSNGDDSNDVALGSTEVTPSRKRRRTDTPILSARVQQLLDRIAGRLHGYHQIQGIAQSSRAWPLLEQGVLARAVGVNDSKVVDLAAKVMKAFTYRFKHGRQMPQPPNPGETIPELLQVCANNTARYGGDWRIECDEPGEIDPSTVLRSPGLSEEEISKLEGRLDIQLPSDYAQFFRTSNGLGETWNGSSMDPELHPADTLQWLDASEEKNSWLNGVEIELLHSHSTILSNARAHPELIENWPTADRVLMIGNWQADSVFLLPPALVRRVIDAYLRLCDEGDDALKTSVGDGIRAFTGSREDFAGLRWCVVTYSEFGMEAWPSFAAYLAQRAYSSGRVKRGDEDEGEARERACFAYSCRD